MNYFFKYIREDNKKFWLFAAWFAFGVIALVDVFAAALGGSIFKLKMFYGFIIVNLVGVVVLIIYKAAAEHMKKRHEKAVEAQAADFEPKREEEIRRILRENPGFNTLCYECIHYNQEKLHCSRDMRDERIKEVRIDDRKYCLYWQEIPKT